MGAIEAALLPNLVGIFGGNIALLGFFALIIIIVLLVLLKLPGILIIPLGIFGLFMLVSESMAGVLTNYGLLIAIPAAFIIAVLIMKFWG